MSDGRITTDTAYLAIIDDLEAKLKASRGWWERLRVTEARIAALEAAAVAYREEIIRLEAGTRAANNRAATLRAAGAAMRTAIDGMSERYAEMFITLGLGDPPDSVAIQDCAAAVAAWIALLKEEVTNGA